MVLDYAERRSTAVVKLLKGFLANTEAPKVRVVLLARADGDWWQGLQRADEALEGLFGLAGVFSLQAPSGMELDRAEAYRDAVNAFYPQAWQGHSCKPAAGPEQAGVRTHLDSSHGGPAGCGWG